MSIKAILSKSTFIKGLQCDKHLYLYKHPYNWQDKISEMQQSVFNRGHRVGALAQSLFLNGVNVKTKDPGAANRGEFRYNCGKDSVIKCIEDAIDIGMDLK